MAESSGAATAAAAAGESQPQSQSQQQQSQHLRRMRLEEASFRLGDSASSKLESDNGVVLSLTLSDAARSSSESIDVALSAAELHKLLTTLRAMTATIGNLAGNGASAE